VFAENRQTLLYTICKNGLIVEQKVREVLKIARRVYVLRNGQVSYSGLAESLKDEAKLRKVYL